MSLIEKIPPHNLEAEEAVLGSILIDKDAIIKIASIISADNFYKEANRNIMDAIIELYSTQQPIDILSLTNKLEEKKLLEKIGGRSYLVSLANAVPTSANVENYAYIVQKKSTLRQLISSAQEMINFGYLEEEEVADILDKSEQLLYKVSHRHLKQNFIPLQNILSEAFERIDEIHKESGKLRGLHTGFTDMDKILGGLQKSDLIILAARPSIGKTSLALDIARNVAKMHTPVGIFSLEMSKEQLVDRIICAEANVDLWKMRTGRLSDKAQDDDFPKIGHALGVLSETPIYIDDSGTCNIVEIRTKARRLQMEHNLGLLVIDYLQLMQGTSKENRVQEMSEISRALKMLARELNIPVLALSQLSRMVEMSNPPIPKLSHLRESGSIEQDADVVMFIYREEYYNKDSSRKNLSDIFVAKHRNGPTGQFELFFDQTKASFRNLDRSYLNQTPPPDAF